MKTKRVRIDYSKVIPLFEKGYSYREIGRMLGYKEGSIACYMLRHYGKVPKGNKEIKLTYLQEQVLFGSLLGDGCLRLETNALNPIFNEEHGIKQLEYMEHKLKVFNNLSNMSSPRINDRYDVRFKEQHYQSCTITLKANPAFHSFYKDFYGNGIKCVPSDLSLLTPLAIAIWFMDDGLIQNQGYGLCTNSFKREETERLAKVLSEEYNLDVTIIRKGTIYIKKNSVLKFNTIIKDYIIDSMLYKLH